MPSIELDIWEMAFLSISSVASAFAAIFAYLSIRQATRTNRTNIFIDFSKRYAADPIAESFREIKFWRDRQGEKFAETWWALFLKEDEGAKRIDEYNRHISLFYLDVSKAFQLGAIDQEMTRNIVSRFGCTMYRDICIPLWRQIYNDPSFQGELPTLNRFHKTRWKR